MNNGIEQRYSTAELNSGIEQRNEQIARELLKNGSDIEFVSSVTNLSTEKLKEICMKIEKDKK